MSVTHGQPYKRMEQIGDARLVRIYALCESDMNVRYIGKTTQHLHQRHKAHIRAAVRGGKLPVNRWLRKRALANEFLTIKLLEFVSRHEDWRARERWWIEKYRREGAALLNLTLGGEGLSGHKFSEEHKAKIAAALRKGREHECTNCGETFYRKPKAAKSENLFCSRSCYQAWQVGKKKNNSNGLMGVAGRAAALEAKRARRNG